MLIVGYLETQKNSNTYSPSTRNSHCHHLVMVFEAFKNAYILFPHDWNDPVYTGSAAQQYLVIIFPCR